MLAPISRRPFVRYDKYVMGPASVTQVWRRFDDACRLPASREGNQRGVGGIRPPILWSNLGQMYGQLTCNFDQRRARDSERAQEHIAGARRLCCQHPAPTRDAIAARINVEGSGTLAAGVKSISSAGLKAGFASSLV